MATVSHAGREEGYQVGGRRGLGVPIALRVTGLQGGVGGTLQGADPSRLSLPEPLSKMVTFPCGAQVELRFHRLFSNVMYVCAKLQAPPAHVADARLLLCRPTVSPPAGPLPLNSHRASFPRAELGGWLG